MTPEYLNAIKKNIGDWGNVWAEDIADSLVIALERAWEEKDLLKKDLISVLNQRDELQKTTQESWDAYQTQKRRAEKAEHENARLQALRNVDLELIAFGDDVQGRKREQAAIAHVRAICDEAKADSIGFFVFLENIRAVIDAF